MHLNICHRKYYLQVVLIHSQIYTFFGRTTITMEIVWMWNCLELHNPLNYISHKFSLQLWFHTTLFNFYCVLVHASLISTFNPLYMILSIHVNTCHTQVCKLIHVIHLRLKLAPSEYFLQNETQSKLCQYYSWTPDTKCKIKNELYLYCRQVIFSDITCMCKKLSFRWFGSWYFYTV